MEKDQILKDEREKLKEILKEVDKQFNETMITYDNLPKNISDEFLLNSLERTYENKLTNLQKAKINPYFARIDFTENLSTQTQQIYIGKTNVFDDTSKAVVIDWRAPISTIYYDGEIGKTKYECPDGIIEGELSLKRQYIIKQAKLLNYNDIDITTNDELLQDCLKENSDIRLKNIVATIQKEQNKIIRSNMFKPLIVQGVAGSGKTTVAIHRIAYLIYTYEKEFKPDEFLIIAPNKFFLGYIENSLPDLGVNYVRQQTFEDFATDIIKDKIKIEDQNKKLIQIVNNDNKRVIIKTSKFKTSLKLKEVIDKYLYEINSNFLEKKDFKIADISVISYEELKQMFLDGYERISLKQRVERLQEFMKLRVSNLSEKILNEIANNRKEKIEKIDDNLTLKEQQVRRELIFKETEYEVTSLIKNMGSKLVQDYIKTLKISSPLEIYKQIMNNQNFEDEEIKEYIETETTLKLKKKMVEYEDLPALIYLQYKLFGIDKKLSLKHIVIDEAQDLGEFQFFVLNELLKNSKSLTILGDLAQGIYEYRGTNNWDLINKNIFNNEANIEYLEQSYRTTYEIMEEANKVIFSKLDDIKVNLAKPVSRHGEKVGYYNSKSFEEKIEIISRKIKDLLEHGLSNIAIIAKNSKNCENIYNKISQSFKNVHIISETSNVYNGGITIVPSYYSKGLEFDAVIIADYNEYSESVLDTKLLYVAMTRAMHTLDIIK